MRLGSFGYKKVATMTIAQRRKVLDSVFVHLTSAQKDEIVRAQLVLSLRNLARLHSKKNAALSSIFAADAEWLQRHVKGSPIVDEHESQSSEEDDDSSESDDDDEPPQQRPRRNKFSAPVADDEPSLAMM